jgi:phosphotriesterase-related protein
MNKINSVLGKIDIDSLGYTLSHEHVLTASAGIIHSYPKLINKDKLIDSAIKEFKKLKKEGIDSIIDVTTMDLGRDVDLLQKVSEASNVNIICATGTWRDIPRSFWYKSTKEISELYIDEIIEGIDSTNIKAGIIKVANDVEGISKEGDTILRSASIASKETGVPISTHSYAKGQIGNEQLKIFKNEGLDLNKVYIGHSNDSTDIDYLENIIQQGAWLGLDRLPGKDPDWNKRLEVTYQLIFKGLEDRIMLSHDWNFESHISSLSEQERQYQNPDGFLFINKKFIPKLLSLGVNKKSISKIMIENPKRFFLEQ